VRATGWGDRHWSWKPVVLLLVVLPLSTCGACYVYSDWWWTGAEAAVRQAVSSTVAGRTPAEVDARVDSGGVLRPSVDFRQPYEITGADNYLAGTSFADVLSPGIWVGHLEFANGHAYHAEARRWQGHWVVTIQPAEGQ
jgi:hypothetical protein